MKAALSEMDQFLLTRPVLGDYEFNEYGFPIVKRASLEHIDWNSIEAANFKNLSPARDNSKTYVLMFQMDAVLERLWKHPLKWIPLFQTCAVVSSPDYSLYESMNINDIRYNVYRSRWVSCLYQYYGCTVAPTIGWIKPDTYDICLGAVEYGSPVTISTIGCQNARDVFLEGFNEMKKRINPQIIVVYGDMIPGMSGTFINFKYEEALAKRATQLRMAEVPRVFTIPEVK